MGNPKSEIRNPKSVQELAWAVLNFPPDIDIFWNTRLFREVHPRVRNTQ
jgi:hypothetical protein